MSRQIELSDEQSRVLAEVAGAHATTSEQVLAELIEELACASGDDGSEADPTSTGRRLLLKMRSRRLPMVVEVTLPRIEPEELIRGLARVLDMPEDEIRARTQIESGNAFQFEDFFRHLGMSEEEIADAVRTADELFPPDEPTDKASPMAEHADPR